MKVVASYEAGAFVRQRGGHLYLWLKVVSGAWGTLKVSTSAPSEDVDWERVDAGGFDVLVDRALPEPKTIQIELRRWPWRRLRAIGFGAGEAGDGDSSPLILWDSAGGGGDGGGGGNGG